jgi:hypothetical protein
MAKKPAPKPARSAKQVKAAPPARAKAPKSKGGDEELDADALEQVSGGLNFASEALLDKTFSFQKVPGIIGPENVLLGGGAFKKKI